MYGLYDNDGVLRFTNSDKEACLDYAQLFEMNSAHFCLMNLVASIDTEYKQNVNETRAFWLGIFLNLHFPF